MKTEEHIKKKIQKCKTCENYDYFFGSCKLYFKEVYLGEGDFDCIPVNIRNVDIKECKYKSIESECE